MFREDLESLSEKVGLLRNHFYNHAFNDGTLLKVAEVRRIADELHRLVEVRSTHGSRAEWITGLLVNIPRFCPVCKEQLWSDEQLMDPQFYRQHHAQQYYKKHTILRHPEFVKWQGKIQRYGAVATVFDAVLLILFVEAPTFGVLFVLSLALSAILVLFAYRRLRNFRDVWRKDHPQTV